MGIRPGFGALEASRGWAPSRATQSVPLNHPVEAPDWDQGLRPSLGRWIGQGSSHTL